MRHLCEDGGTRRCTIVYLLAVGEQADRLRVVVEGLIEPADGADVEPDDDDLFGSAAPPLRRFRVTSPPAQRP